MRRWWHFVVPAAGLVLQLIPPFFFLAMGSATYGASGFLPENLGAGLSLLGLTMFALLSIAAGVCGLYGLLTRVRPAVAVPLVVICSVPALIGGAIYLHALLVFLTLA